MLCKDVIAGAFINVMNAKKTDKGGANRSAVPTFSWMSCPPNLTAETASSNGLRTAETASSNGVRCFFLST